MSFTVKRQKDLFSLPLAFYGHDSPNLVYVLATVNLSKYLPYIVFHDTLEAFSLLCLVLFNVLE
jgi:hypothetical protein